MGFNFKASGNTPAKGGFSIGGASRVPDPLADVEYSGDLAKDAGRELSALQKGFAERAAAEVKRFEKATDSEYWFAVCFDSRDECEAFLTAAKVNRKLMGDKYLDGRQFAKVLGIKF